MTHGVVVPHAGGSYPVLVGRGALDRLPELLERHVPEVARWAVVSDSNVAPLWGLRVAEALSGAGADVLVETFPAGEAHKTREQWGRLTDALLAAGLGRDGGVIAVGGGVTGDLAGFVAATYMRGVPVVQVPTSVVAMVDSAVGGKTGVDTPGGKNLVGAFHPPRLVVADARTVETLDRSERAQGWAEAVKHGAILDEAYFERLADDAPALLDGRPDAVEAAVHRSVELKAEVVAADERERGRREILNFGHTLAHALEAESRYRLSHGSAVAIGMVLEARVGERAGVTEPGTARRLADALARFALPVSRPPGAAAAIVARTGLDKKVRRGRARYVLLERIGRVGGGETGAVEVDAEVVQAVLEEVPAQA